MHDDGLANLGEGDAVAGSDGGLGNAHGGGYKSVLGGK